MTCEELYHELVQRGVHFSIKGEHLAFAAPKGSLTPDLINQMKRNKQGLLECVRAMSSDSMATTASPDSNDSYPASYGQEALWLIHQSNPHSAAYNTAASLRIHSPVNVDAMRKALTLLLMRHESLRTTFEQKGATLYANIASPPKPDFLVIDAGQWDEQQIADQAKLEYETPFDLKSGPLFRTRLFSIAPDHHIILLTLHHIIFDASSLWILQSELQRLYQAEVEESAGILPALPATYRDFATWQRNFPDSAEGNQQWNYWQSQLKGDPCPGELPWSKKRTRTIHRSCATITRSVGDSTAKGLRNVARSLGTTPFSVAMATFQILVKRCSGQDDFVLGTTSSGRSQPRFAGEIGYFVNILPIRSTITDSMSFAELVNQTKKTMLEATQAGDFPFSLLIKRLNPLRDANAAPLCRMVFGWQKSHAFSEVAHLLDADGETVDWGGMRAQSYPLTQQEGQFDLTLEVHEGAKSLGCVLKYDRNLMTDDAASRVLEQYIQLLDGITTDPQRSINHFDLHTPAEQLRLQQWSTGQPLAAPSRLRLDDIWSDTVQSHPHSLALQYEEKSWDYAELDARVNETANRFLQLGIEPGDRIVLNTGRGPHVPICILAALKCGATYIPTAPDSPDERLFKILEECKPALVITCDDRAAHIRSLAAGDSTVRGLSDLQVDPSRLLDEASGLAPTSTWQRLDFAEATTAYIIYTSGSTGTPKGVAVSHAAISYHLASVARLYELCDHDRVLQFCDLTFDPSLEQFLTPWSVGAAVVMRADNLFSSAGFWRRVKSHQITVANLPPSFMVECARSVEDNSPLRLMIVGGDVFPSQHLDQWLAKNIRTINAYGPTETVITATTHDVSLDSLMHRGSIPIGKPKPGSVAYVIDRQGGLCPVGVTGELCLGGPMLADGYVNGTPTDNARFTQDPFIGGTARMYKTGDWAKWNEQGELEFLGRIDRQIKVRGFRVEPGEIEHAMISVEGIEQAVIRLCQTDTEQFLVGYFIPAPETEIAVEVIVRQLKALIPSYMIPDRFMSIDQWPLKASGKVDLERLPIPAKRVNATSSTPPENRLQQLIAQSWCEVLEVKTVGIDDDFLEIGGGSLQSLRILTKLGEFGIVTKDKSMELSPQLLFQYTTIRELSELLEITCTANPSMTAGMTSTPDAILT